MRLKYNILVPQMSPIHFTYLEEAMKACGYNAVLLPPVDKNSVEGASSILTMTPATRPSSPGTDHLCFEIRRI